MTLDKAGAGSEFEEMAKKEILGHEANRALDEFYVCRYDFASKVAQDQELAQEDMFEYLEHWADYNIAIRNWGDLPIREFHTLRSDCENKKLTDIVENHLNERIEHTKKMIPIAERQNLRLTQNAFLGLEIPDTPLARGAQDSVSRVANSSMWLPFELKGLEKCTIFFKKE